MRINSTDPLSPPLIDLAFLTHPFDRAALIEGVRQTKRFYSGLAWDGYLTGFNGPDPDADTSPAGQEEFWDKIKADMNSFFHPCGTAAISPKGSGIGRGEGVVDNVLKVKTVKGLRVADAAVIVSRNVARLLILISLLRSHLALCANGSFAGSCVYPRGKSCRPDQGRVGLRHFPAELMPPCPRKRY